MISHLLPFSVVCLWGQHTAWSSTVFDEFGNEKQPTEIYHDVWPPVVYSQTKGPLYIKHSTHYQDIWCNATEGARVSWLYQGTDRTGGQVRMEFSDVDPGGFTERFLVETNLNSSRLTVASLHPEEYGFVQCSVSNTMGRTIGDRVYVRLSVLNRTGEKESHKCATEGGHVILSCDGHFHDIPPSNVTWHKGVDRDSSLAAIDRFYCDGAGTTCALTNVTASDTGEYTCYYYKYNRAEEKMFHVNVTRAANDESCIGSLDLMSLVSSPGTVVAQKGTALSLQCVFRGEEYTVHWLYSTTESCDSVPDTIGNGDNEGRAHVTRNGSVLVLQKFTQRDQGYYTCVATSAHDLYTHRIHVLYEMPPQLRHTVYQHSISEGESVQVNCSAPGSVPAPRVEWFVNMHPVDNLTRYVTRDGGQILVLANATAEDTASILCNVSNSAGYSLGYRSVKVNREPTPGRITERRGLSPQVGSPQVEIPSPPLDCLLSVTGMIKYSNHLRSMADSQCDDGSISGLVAVLELHKAQTEALIAELMDRSPEASRTLPQPAPDPPDPGLGADPQSTHVYSAILNYHTGVPDIEQSSEFINYRCTELSGCRISASTPIHVDLDTTKPTTQRSKVVLDTHGFISTLEVKTMYKTNGALRRLRLHLSTAETSSTSKCRRKHTSSVEITLERRLHAGPADLKLHWQLDYYNPLTHPRHRNSKTCTTKSPKIKLQARRSQGNTPVCWRANGVHLHGRHGGNVQALTRC